MTTEETVRLVVRGVVPVKVPYEPNNQFAGR